MRIIMLFAAPFGPRSRMCWRDRSARINPSISSRRSKRRLSISAWSDWKRSASTIRGIRLRRRGAQIPFDGLRAWRHQRHDSDSGVRCEERNEFVLAPLSIQPVQDLEIAGPVLMSEEDQLEQDVSLDVELAVGPRVIDHEAGVPRRLVGVQAVLDRHEEAGLPRDRLGDLSLVRELEVDRIPIHERAGHRPGSNVRSDVYLSPNSSNGAVGVLPRRMSSGSCGFPFSHTSSMDRSGAHRLWEMSAGIAVQSPGFM